MNIPEKYAADVLAGKVVCGKLAKKAVARYYNDLANCYEKGIYIDEKAGLKAIKFIERLKHTKGKWAGKPVVLEPWQQFIVYNIFAWKRADGTRRYRYVYIEVARKNGKTTLSAGIALYMLFADGEFRPEVYSVATVRDQAKICFADAVEIVKNTALKSRLQVWTNSITYDAKGGTMRPLSSDAGIQDGLSPSCVIVDEYHAHKTNDMFDVMKSGMGARTQPLMFIITTSGFNRNGPCYAYRRNVINILNGVAHDDSIFGMIYTIDETDSWTDPAVWKKSNPNLGISLDATYLKEQVDDARNRPEAERNVKTKNLNVWVDAEQTWILQDVWAKCSGSMKVEDLEGCRAWGGLDLSNVSDMTAYVLLFNENGRYQLLPFFWIPEDTLTEKIKSGHIDFQAWVNAGYITVTPGNVTDYSYVEHDIAILHEKYDIQSSAYDRWNSSQTIINLQNEDMEFNPMGQGFGSMSAPTKEFERLVYTGEIEHFGNPVLAWMLASVAINKDAAGNIKPDKRKSTQKIDGIVASIMALGEYMTKNDSRSSIYEERGLRE